MTAILLGLATTAYLLVATTCVRTSLDELKAKGKAKPLNQMGAILAGTLWPITLGTILLWAAASRSAGPAEDREGKEATGTSDGKSMSGLPRIKPAESRGVLR